MQRIENIKNNLIIDRGGQNKEIIVIKDNIFEKISALGEFLRAFGLEMRVRVIWANIFLQKMR